MNSIFAQRSSENEIMDDLSCSGEVVSKTLKELDVINKWLGGNAVTIHGIDRLLKNHQDIHHLTIADLGCGSGEMLKQFSQWATENKIRVSITGFDANKNIIAYAKHHLNGLSDVELNELDIFSSEFKAFKFDIVTGTLFFHHFPTEKLIEFLRQLKNQVRIGIVINDIHRHWVAFHSIKLLTQFFSQSPMVKHDAPLSVLRAFSKKELIDIMTKAGLTDFTIKWHWAFRWQVVIKA